MTSIYRVETEVVSVRMCLGRGDYREGEMFLRPSVVVASGVETLCDRLNDRDSFVPLRVGGKTLLVGKVQIRYACRVGESSPPLPEGATMHSVCVELDGGDALSGEVVSLSMPAAMRRVLDVMNAEHEGPFVELRNRQGSFAINRRFVRAVREVEGEG